ncbi:MAG: signal peptidase II [Acidobacteriota bacterium]
MASWVGIRPLELRTAAAIVVADQVIKVLVRNALELHDSVPIIPPLLALTRVHNTGAAFGVLNGLEFPGKGMVFTFVSILALAGVAWYAASVPLTDRLARLGIACIIGGAVGNLIDRAAAGYVLDFVDFAFGGWHFWAFNVADASITVGVALLILDLAGLGRRASNTV